MGSRSPRTVRQKILLGARKWNGPREGLVFILFLRNARNFTGEGQECGKNLKKRARGKG